MRNNEDVNKKLRGYYPTFRGKYLLLTCGVLSHKAFILYDVSIVLADWDKRHEDYGVLGSTQEEIEHILRKSKGFVSRNSKELYKAGFWQKDQKGKIHVIGFELIEPKLLKAITKKNKIVNLQDYIAKPQLYSALLQQEIAEEQLNSPKAINSFQGKNVAVFQLSTSKSLVSSKGEYNFRDDSGEYTEDFIRDVEESLRESTPIKNKEGGYE